MIYCMYVVSSWEGEIFVEQEKAEKGLSSPIAHYP